MVSVKSYYGVEREGRPDIVEFQSRRLKKQGSCQRLAALASFFIGHSNQQPASNTLHQTDLSRYSEACDSNELLVFAEYAEQWFNLEPRRPHG